MNVNACWGEILYRLSRPLVRLAADLLFTLDVRWHTPLPRGSKIIAPNHPSTTDPFLIALLANERVHILIDETLFRVPVLGAYLEQTGHVCVVHEQGRAAYDRARDLLRGGHTVVVFPEGAVSPLDGGFHLPRTGIARLALETGAPIVPVGIHLQRERLRIVETRVRGKTEVGTWYLGGHYAVTGGAAFYLNGSVQDRDLVRLLAQQVMQQVIDLSQQGEQRLRLLMPAPAWPAAI